MKKLFAAVAAAVFVIGTAAVLPNTGRAGLFITADAGTAGENIKYTEKNGVLTISGTGDMKDWDNTMDSPWKGHADIKKAVIAEGITSIGERTFVGCTGLEEIELPNTLRTISKGAFTGCTSLKKIVIPDSVTTIGFDAFGQCSGLEEAVIGKNVRTIDISAFRECTSLESITLPDSVTEIGGNAFFFCTSLKEAYLSDNIREIPTGIFGSCEKLEKVKLPAKLEKINTYCFRNCCSLKEIKIPDGMKKVDNGAFSSCTDMTITVPVTLQSMDLYLKDLTIRGYTGSYFEYIVKQYNKDHPEEPVKFVSIGKVTPGDVNCDGRVDIIDAVRLINYINGQQTVTDLEFANADVDLTFSLDIMDVGGIINHINGVKHLQGIC